MKIKNPLLRYLALSFGIAWIAEAIAIILERTILPVGIVSKVIVMCFVGFGGGMAPLYAVFLVRRHENPEYKLKSLLHDIFKTESLPRTLIVLGVIAALLLVKCCFIEKSVGNPWYMWLPMFILMIPGGGLEEAGWRGYFFPELEKRTNFALASLIQGVIWAVWHIPLWFVQNASQHSFNFVSFLIYCVILSFELGLLVKLTHTTWAAIVLHAWLNTIFGGMYTYSILTDKVSPLLLIMGIVEIGICILVALIFDKKKKKGVN